MGKSRLNLSENTQYIFWPDLAGAHYSNKFVQFLNDQNIKFVPKSENPLNTDEISCIEDFKGLIKGEVYKDDWEAENLAQLRTRILIRFKNVDQEYILNLGESTRRRIYPIKRFGLVEIR